MKRNVIIAGLVALLLVAVLTVSLVSAPKKGTVETFSELQDERLGSVYVLGRYDGLLNGWDVAFLHRDNQTNWLAYYLAHESRGWGKANLQFDGKLVTVNKGNTTVAEYDTESGTFTHKLQGVAYSKKDADVDQRDAAFWNLAGIQRRE